MPHLPGGIMRASRQGDLTADSETQRLFNFTEPSDKLTVADLSPNASTGYLTAGYTGATAPALISTLPIHGDPDFNGFIGIDDLKQVLSH